MESTHDVVVIGSGPGGYVAALHAAKAGLRVACVERERLGGVCLNWGCIPSKALLKSAEYARLARHLGDYGVHVGEVRVDYAQVVARSRQVADRSERGVSYLFRKHGVTSVAGTARLAGAGRVVVTAADGAVQELVAPHVIVATGARARAFPGMEPDGERILTYREAIVAERCPGTAVVLGAGAIGLEFAWLWSSMGAAVTLVEAAPQIAPTEDADIARELAKELKSQGISIRTGVRCRLVERAGDGVRVHLEDGVTLEADVALLALGVRANTEDLGLQEAGVALDPHGGFIRVDDHQRTTAPGVWAIGDVAGPPMLAHKASAEAHACVQAILGRPVHPVNRLLIPAGTFCQPQVASVGRTEARLQADGVAYTVGRFPFAANGKNRGTGHTAGFVKVLVDRRHGEILGAHIVGHDATELLGELVLAASAELDAETFLQAIHSHPTSSEAVMEAVAEALGAGVHL